MRPGRKKIRRIPKRDKTACLVFLAAIMLPSPAMSQSGFAEASGPLPDTELLRVGQPGPGKEKITTEYKIKAACLFKFCNFVKWPEEAFKENEEALKEKPSPIVIGILGKDPFGAYLDDLVKGERIGKRDLVVVRFKRFKDLKPCHILFVSSSEKPRFRQILKKLEKTWTLTVADTEGFARLGGIVNFYVDKKVRFEINSGAAEKARLKISSKLLRLARIVKTNKKET